MASLRFRRVPENDLVDLTDVDLRVLDWALCALKDARHLTKGKFDLGAYESETLEHLHDLVLKIKKGWAIVDE